MTCLHPDFLCEVEVNRLGEVDDGPVTGYSADVTVICASCGVPFQWIGVDGGLSPQGPRVSASGTELRAPLQPANAIPSTQRMPLTPGEEVSGGPTGLEGVDRSER